MCPKDDKHAPFCEEKAFWHHVKVGSVISSLLSFFFLIVQLKITMLGSKQTREEPYTPAGSGNL